VPATSGDQPALRPAETDGSPGRGPLEPGHDREVMVQFADRTWRLCRVTAWQRGRAPGAWWCKLRWGVSGDLYEAWYFYDQAMVRESS
jgi:hypothetical protein